jgi:glycosyltransferase involved in cell wall biosynthesis
LSKVVTSPHGVDDPPAATGALSSDIAAAIAGAPAVLAFGRISWEKGLDRLIAALPLVPAARVIIAGGDGGQAGALVEQARKLGLADRVTIIARHVDGADKEALFASASAFAMTSLSENFGLAAFEAMRRGLPVLATPDVGMSEIVAKAQAGVIVDPSSPEGIARGLATLLGDRDASRVMGESGRALVIAEYGWNAVAERMTEVYRAAIQGQSGRTR